MESRIPRSKRRPWSIEALKAIAPSMSTAISRNTWGALDQVWARRLADLARIGLSFTRLDSGAASTGWGRRCDPGCGLFDMAQHVLSADPALGPAPLHFRDRDAPGLGELPRDGSRPDRAFAQALGDTRSMRQESSPGPRARPTRSPREILGPSRPSRGHRRGRPPPGAPSPARGRGGRRPGRQPAPRYRPRSWSVSMTRITSSPFTVEPSAARSSVMTPGLHVARHFGHQHFESHYDILRAST